MRSFVFRIKDSSFHIFYKFFSLLETSSASKKEPFEFSF